MPFKSQKQARHLYAKHPEIAKKWNVEYHQKVSKLPVKKRSKKSS